MRPRSRKSQFVTEDPWSLMSERLEKERRVRRPPDMKLIERVLGSVLFFFLGSLLAPIIAVIIISLATSGGFGAIALGFAVFMSAEYFPYLLVYCLLFGAICAVSAWRGFREADAQ